MAPRVHPCLCGYTCERYPQMRYHRRHCEVWKNRPNPKELARKRQKASKKAPKRRRCPKCKQLDTHADRCPNSREELARRNLLRRHGIDPVFFELFLRALAERYEDRSP